MTKKLIRLEAVALTLWLAMAPFSALAKPFISPVGACPNAFEQTEPRPKASLAFQEPELYSAVLRLPSDQAAIEALLVNRPLAQAASTLERLRCQTTDRLRELLRAFGHRPKVRQLLWKALERLEFEGKTADHFHEKLKFFDPREVVDLDHRNSEHAKLFLGILSTLTGAVGELRASLIAEDVVTSGIHIKEIRNVDLSRLTPEELKKEIDLIFERGDAWGEVKNFKYPLKNAGRAWNKLTLQIQQLFEIRNKTNPSIQLHLFILNGLTRQAARDLKNLGWVVHGPIYP